MPEVNEPLVLPNYPTQAEYRHKRIHRKGKNVNYHSQEMGTPYTTGYFSTKRNIVFVNKRSCNKGNNNNETFRQRLIDYHFGNSSSESEG